MIIGVAGICTHDKSHLSGLHLNILNGRGKHIIDMLEHIRSFLMERHHKNLISTSNVTDLICPRVRKKIEDAEYKSRSCVTLPAVGDKFQVSIGEDQFIVDLHNRTCTCRAWDLTGIPCIHGCATIQFMKMDVATFVHWYYTVPRYIEAYRYPLQPLNGKKMWPEVAGEPIKPPPYKKMPGRPKKKRKRNPEEEGRTETKLRRFGLQMICQKCLKPGHNKRTCTNEVADKPSKAKVGRPRKRNASINVVSGTSVTTTPVPATGSQRKTFKRASTRSQTSSTTHARERTMAGKGYGVYAGAEMGYVYIRRPEETVAHVIASTNVASNSTTSTRGRGRGRGRGGRSGISEPIGGTQESATLS